MAFFLNLWKIISMSKTYIDKLGYLRFKDSGLSVSRWVVAKTIGRKLKPKEIVHHKNRVKTDNSPNNLQLCKDQK